MIWKDSETEFDFLDFDYMADLIHDIALDDSLSPSTIGVYGDWGSGKSSLMDMVKKRISEDEDKSVLVVDFNGWLFEGYDDAKTALCGTILDRIAEEKSTTNKVVDKVKDLRHQIDTKKILGKGVKYGLDVLLTGGLATVADITIESIVGRIKKKFLEASPEELEALVKNAEVEDKRREHIKNFHKEFSELLKEGGVKHLIVFIDELDRCTPDTVLDVFEAIRLFLFAEGTSFIIGADERLIQYAIETRYKSVPGNNLDIGKEYMEKMIQYPVTIPRLNDQEVKKYISCLLAQEHIELDDLMPIIKGMKTGEELSYEYVEKINHDKAQKIKGSLDLANQISSVLASILNGNPRHCKRFLNSMFMRIRMAKSRNIKLDQNVLAKLMLAEYYKQSFYDMLAEGNIREEIAKLEKGEEAENGKIASFQDTDMDWINKWAKITPAISEMELAPYFYFSRDNSSLRHVGSYNLSPIGVQCMNNLLDKTDTGRSKGIKLFNELIPKEKEVVYDAIYSTMTGSSKIESEIFKSFIQLSMNEELKEKALKMLQAIPAERYEPYMIAELLNFDEKTQEDLYSYLSSNDKLKTLIKINKKHHH